MGTRRSPEGADLEMIVTIPHLHGAVYVEAATGLRVSWPTPAEMPDTTKPTTDRVGTQ